LIFEENRQFFFIKFAQSGTDVMILKIFSPKNFAKKLKFLNQSKAKLFKNLIITLVFVKNANFFSEKSSFFLDILVEVKLKLDDA
jgi:hypothetical protein